MNAVAVIQTHFTDFLPNDTDPSHYCLTALRKSRHVESVILAAPDTPENRVFVHVAEQWGVNCYLGYEYDVVKRIIRAAEKVGAREETVVVRVLLNRFYLDIDLIDRMIDLLVVTHSDLVMLPYDFDINFGADVLTLECLYRVDQMLARPGVEHLRFRPWLFIEDHPESFRIVNCTDVPSYPRDFLTKIRASGLFSERDCGTCSKFTYEFVLQFLQPDDVVLDIACGTGDGTALLAQKTLKAHGADLHSDILLEARQKYTLPNLVFDVQDGCAMTYPDGYFNAVVCLNTLEHVTDDRFLLRNCYRVLCPSGQLILEVPLLRRRPFNSPLISSHLREYEKESLLDLISSCGFIPERKFGMNRGQYVTWERDREAALVVARRSS